MLLPQSPAAPPPVGSTMQAGGPPRGGTLLTRAWRCACETLPALCPGGLLCDGGGDRWEVGDGMRALRVWRDVFRRAPSRQVLAGIPQIRAIWQLMRAAGCRWGESGYLLPWMRACTYINPHDTSISFCPPAARIPGAGCPIYKHVRFCTLVGANCEHLWARARRATRHVAAGRAGQMRQDVSHRRMHADN